MWLHVLMTDMELFNVLSAVRVRKLELLFLRVRYVGKLQIILKNIENLSLVELYILLLLMQPAL